MTPRCYKRGLSREHATLEALRLGFPQIPYVCTHCGHWHVGEPHWDATRFWNKSRRARYLTGQEYKMAQIGEGPWYNQEIPRPHCACLASNEPQYYGMGEDDAYPCECDCHMPVATQVVSPEDLPF